MAGLVGEQRNKQTKRSASHLKRRGDAASLGEVRAQEPPSLADVRDRQLLPAHGVGEGAAGRVARVERQERCPGIRGPTRGRPVLDEVAPARAARQGRHLHARQQDIPRGTSAREKRREDLVSVVVLRAQLRLNEGPHRVKVGAGEVHADVRADGGGRRAGSRISSDSPGVLLGEQVRDEVPHGGEPAAAPHGFELIDIGRETSCRRGARLPAAPLRRELRRVFEAAERARVAGTVAHPAPGLGALMPAARQVLAEGAVQLVVVAAVAAAAVVAAAPIFAPSARLLGRGRRRVECQSAKRKGFARFFILVEQDARVLLRDERALRRPLGRGYTTARGAGAGPGAGAGAGAGAAASADAGAGAGAGAGTRRVPARARHLGDRGGSWHRAPETPGRAHRRHAEREEPKSKHIAPCPSGAGLGGGGLGGGGPLGGGDAVQSGAAPHAWPHPVTAQMVLRSTCDSNIRGESRSVPCSELYGNRPARAQGAEEVSHPCPACDAVHRRRAGATRRRKGLVIGRPEAQAHLWPRWRAA